MLPVLAASIAWTLTCVEFTFYDSMNNYRSPNVLGIVWGITLALPPTVGCFYMIYCIWSTPSDPKYQTLFSK
jgi:hypothetical protein